MGDMAIKYKAKFQKLNVMIDNVKKICLDIINDNVNNNYVDYNNIKVQIRERLSKYFYNETECKPMIIAVIQEV